jgi:photosystem II stability/assembly factor-like uncharacterized protein
MCSQYGQCVTPFTDLNYPFFDTLNIQYEMGISADGQTLVVPTFRADGIARLSTNGGDNWSIITPQNITHRDVNDVGMSTDGQLIALIENNPYAPGADDNVQLRRGYIWISRDRGQTFEKQTAAGERVWSNIEMSNDGNKVIAIDIYSGNMYLGTYNSSSWSWSQKRLPSTSSLYGQFLQASDNLQTLVYIRVGTSGTVHISFDGGDTWQTTSRSFPNDAYVSSDGSIMGYRYNPNSNRTLLYYSNNGNWSTINFPYGIWWNLNISPDGSKIIAEYGTQGDNYGRWYYSSDGGQTGQWLDVDIDSPQFHDNGDLYAVVSGRLSRSSDNGQTFTSVPGRTLGVQQTQKLTLSHDDEDLFVGYQNTYSGDVQGYLINIDSSGLSLGDRFDDYFYDGSSVAVSDNDSYFVTSTGFRRYQFEKVSSGGTTNMYPNLGSRGTRSSAVDSTGQLVLAGAGSGGIARSTNGGSTWTTLDGVPSGQWLDMSCSETCDNAVAALASNVVYYSEDAGLTWTAGQGLNNRTWKALDMSSDGQHAAVTDGSNVSVSHDGGATWTQVTYPGGGSIDIAISDDGQGLAIATQNGYLRFSTDGGQTWFARMTDKNRDWRAIDVNGDFSEAWAGYYTEDGNGIVQLTH